MALYTDGPIASLDDLRRYDNTVLDVANAENIDLDTKIEIAQREIGLEIASFLLRNGADLRLRRDLRKVLVTEPLLHAHCVHTLELVYRDAYNSQLNDRYGGRWKEYRELSKQARDLLFQIGVALVDRPIVRASAPTVRYIVGPSNADASYDFAIAWIGLDGAAGSLSETVVFSVPAGHIPTVSAPSLPAQVAGWHIWAGVSGDLLVRQTDVPLGSGSSWALPVQGLRSDLPGIPEQAASQYIISTGQLKRG